MHTYYQFNSEIYSPTEKQAINNLVNIIDSNYTILKKIYPKINETRRKLKSFDLISQSLTNDDFMFLLKETDFLKKTIESEDVEKKQDTIINTLDFLSYLFSKTKSQSINNSIYDKKIENTVYKIESLHTRIEELEKEKALLNSQAVQENEAKAKEIEKYKKLLTQSEADKAALIKRYEAEKERQNKIRDDWENNINRAFEALNEGAKVVNDEYKRIKRAHLFYGLGIVFSVSLLSLLVRYTILSLYMHDEIMTYVQYIPYYLPLAFCGTLIWICIYQTNKLQRQLIVLADKIYRIKYLEGALKGLNNVEQDKNLLSQKTINVLDRIINKHLNESFKDMNEKNIEKEEAKDTYPVDNLIKFMKEYKELIKK